MAAVALLFKPFFQALSLYISGRMLFPAHLVDGWSCSCLIIARVISRLLSPC